MANGASSWWWNDCMMMWLHEICLVYLLLQLFAWKYWFSLFFTKAWPTDGRTDRPTDRWTDQRTGKPGYRDARTHLKTEFIRIYHLCLKCGLLMWINYDIQKVYITWTFWKTTVIPSIASIGLLPVAPWSSTPRRVAAMVRRQFWIAGYNISQSKILLKSKSTANFMKLIALLTWFWFWK